MKERPILFSGPMVKAILDGRKTMTRRVVKPQPGDPPSIGAYFDAYNGGPQWNWWTNDNRLHNDVPIIICPYGQPGDRLWVRETWKYAGWTEDGEPWIQYATDESKRLIRDVPYDWQDRIGGIWAALSAPENYMVDNTAADRRWRSPRFMPRWASRLTLEIVSVRVERVQEISEEDAGAEGLQDWYGNRSPYCTNKDRFVDLRDSINSKRGHSWDSNPWVWLIEFRPNSGAR
jgi:hypothetical protein